MDDKANIITSAQAIKLTSLHPHTLRKYADSDQINQMLSQKWWGNYSLYGFSVYTMYCAPAYGHLFVDIAGYLSVSPVYSSSSKYVLSVRESSFVLQGWCTHVQSFLPSWNLFWFNWPTHLPSLLLCSPVSCPPPVCSVLRAGCCVLLQPDPIPSMQPSPALWCS